MMLDYQIVKNYDNDRWSVACDRFKTKACFSTFYNAQKWINKISKAERLTIKDKTKVFIWKS